MTVKEVMDRAGVFETGRAIAYIKDALDEMAMDSPTHIRTSKIDIVADKRFYDIPLECVKILDIRVLDHNNDSNRLQTIPRSIFEPAIEDTDGI